MRRFCFNSYELNNLTKYKDRIDRHIDVYQVSTASSPKNNSLIFINKIDKQILKNISSTKESIILIKENPEIIKDEDYLLISKENIVLKVDNPRREYAIILNYILQREKATYAEYKVNALGYVLGKGVIIGNGTKIEPFAFIGDYCSIGDNCIIKSGAKIRENTVIGDNCIIKENCVIGDEGFGIERDEQGIPYRIPHLGGVVIGSNVEVGALVSIAQGTIEPTIIEDYVKIDDCAFIAHNCKIGRGTYIIANAEISGSVVIGRNSWIGPSAAIINGVKLGNNVTVGIGSVVIKNVEDGIVVAGNPADTTENLRRLNKIMKSLLAKGKIKSFS
ncbi:UDP-3-O-(3-hydroxymyristoyl)glucosamine N-acyltransferase [Clostridium manihotivorum]|uniref:UDP-3-O-(3-hydroxymyristoyl)glucosamine N-acyltransferase n=1 Tax=Clostridium manihotivorum TaxID=2320868 RepID=A0A410DNB9_9CLOT|nr:UDP-3-O-(3-hydroxymyristoyl)glucosamine N-acyltransferase [Clostridium manihotivorum]QAA30593.1 UDP-3-O-(3-hydroxymyristoyl)glucosamine N-acyltransferase [Clostridium manihotivorum]